MKERYDRSALIGGPMPEDLHGPVDKARRPSLVVYGIGGGVLFPIVGLVIAIILLTRNEVGPGLAVLIVSVLSFLTAIALLG